MNLYFRVLLTLLKNLFQRIRCSITDKMVWTGRVLPNDIDVFGHMNNGRYLTLIGLALFDAGIKSGNFKATVKFKYVYLFSNTDIQWIKPLRLFEKFSIESHLKYWEHNRAYVEVEFRNGKGQVVSKASYKVVIKSPVRRGVTWRDLMPADVLEARDTLDAIETLDASPTVKPNFAKRLDRTG